MPRKTPETVNRLHRVDVRRLEDYTREHYVTSGMTDGAFAKQAAEALTLTLTPHNIAAAREVFGIPSNIAAARAAVSSRDPSIVMQRLAALEREVAGLRDAFAVFKHGRRGDK